LVKKLAAARKTYSRFFEDGEYFGSKPVSHVQRGLSSLYRHGDQWMLILTNLAEKPVLVSGAGQPVTGGPAVGMHILPPSSVAFFLWRTGEAEWASA
jgi:hypothetical protein